MYVTVGTGNSHDSLRRMIPTDIEKSDDILRMDNLISDAHVECPRSKSLGEATNALMFMLRSSTLVWLTLDPKYVV